MSEISNHTRSASNPTPKELVLKYVPYLPWVLLSLLIFLTGAYLKLRYSTPIYNVNGKLLVKDNNSYGNGSDKLNTLLMLPGDNSNLSNEIQIIKSRSMASRVIRGLGMQQQYAQKGSIRTSQAHGTEIPFKWVVEKINDSLNPCGVEVLITGDNQFQINENPTLYSFGQSVHLPQLSFKLIPAAGFPIRPSSMIYILQWVPEQMMAVNLSGSIGVEKQEGTSVLTLSYLVENRNVGLDVINRYMKEYQLSSLEDKKLIAATTANFIDEQLDTLQQELGGVERNLQHFREENKLYSPDRQATIIFDQFSQSNQEINEQLVKTKILDYLLNYLSDEKNRDKLVPSNLGIEEASLLAQITEFNVLQLKKETLLKTTTENNYIVVDVNAAIEKLRQGIVENLRNVKISYEVRIAQMNNLARKTEANISSIPSKEKQLLEVTRQQSILQELYSFLLQKKLETGISSASTISDIKMLEPAMAGNIPISPNPVTLYTVATFLGILIPVIVIFLIDYLNDKVKTKNDIVKSTNAPVIGEVGHVDDAVALVVRNNNRAYVAEQFRIIRSNLQYILPRDVCPVIMVTSSFSGEGKSFISTNLGAVLSLSGKKTVIIEMDIRKPKILKGLGMDARLGFTNYLISDVDISSITYKVPELENLYVIPCGPIPPNPAELLLDKKVGVLFSELKKNFDAIIVDTAPVGLVSDAVTLGEFCNVTIFIVRHNYTLKKQVTMIDSLYMDKKLPKLGIIINDIKASLGGYYGYGYGYGLGSYNSDHGGYFETGRKKKFRLFRGNKT